MGRWSALLLAASLLGCPAAPESSALPICEAPADPAGRYDAALADSGVRFTHVQREGLDGLPARIDLVLSALAAGVVAADLDADGHPDLLFTQDDGANALYWGLGDGTFEEAMDAGIGFPDARTFGASAADYDGDGLLDLALSQLHGARVLRNRGDRSFEDVSEALGLTANDGAGTTSAWGDVDGDGDLDLYSGFVFLDIDEDQDPPVDPTAYVPSTGRDNLWRNDGESFVDIAAPVLPRGNDGAVLHAAFTDWDDDGDLDLLQANDGEISVNSFLWENQGLSDDGMWTPLDRLPASGIGVLHAPMGFSMLDLDDDGRRDLVFSSTDGARGLRGEEPWTFVDVSAQWLSAAPRWPFVGWSVVPVDPDGDGDLGLFSTYGPLHEEYMVRRPEDDAGPDAVWRTSPDVLLSPIWVDGERSFIDDSALLSTPSLGNNRGVGVADFDGNGVPDLAIAALGGPPALYLGACTEAHRLVVALRDEGPNPFGIGARVTVVAGGKERSAELTAGGHGSFSGSDPELFFGLGDATRVSRLEVRWPDGATEVYRDLCGDCRVVLRRAP